MLRTNRIEHEEDRPVSRTKAAIVALTLLVVSTLLSGPVYGRAFAPINPSHGGAIRLVDPAGSDEPITVEDLKRLLSTEPDQEEIIAYVRKNARDLEVRRKDLSVLKQAGAGGKLLAVLEGIIAAPPDLCRDVLRRLKDKQAEKEILDQILSQGRILKLSTAQKVDLSRAGASNEIILALEGRFVPKGFASYKPEHRLFSIQHPTGWKAHHWFTASGSRVIVSPDEAVDELNKFKLGVQIQVTPLSQAEGSDAGDALEIYMKGLPSFLRLNRSFELEPFAGARGKPRKVRLAGREGVRQNFNVTMVNSPCAEILVKVRARGFEFFMEFVAPRGEFAALEKTFERMLTSFRPLPDEVEVRRRSQAIEASDLMDRYRGSVVQVRSYVGGKPFGTGTGFFVREDGYLVTNHHVICTKKRHQDCTHRSRMKLADSFSVVFDAGIANGSSNGKQIQRPATVVATVYMTNPRADLALLRVPCGKQPYRPLPLAAVGMRRSTGLSREGDPVMAIGFPLSHRFGSDRLILTTGDVSKLDYGENKKLKNLLCRLVINKGNSGGPLFNRVTGAVVGVTTSYDVALKGDSGVAGEKLGYTTSCAIDYVFEFFPQIRFYPLGRTLPPEGHVELAGMLLTRNNTTAAMSELVAAERDRDRMNITQRAELSYQTGRYFSMVNQVETARKALGDCLRWAPDHVGALQELAWLQPQDRVDLALKQLDHLVKVAPDEWYSFYMRAEFRRRAKLLDKAMEDLTHARDELCRSGDVRIFCLQARILRDQKQPQQARAAYDRALALDERSFEARQGLARLHEGLKRNDRALLEYQRLVGDHPQTSGAHESLGRCLISLKRKREGMQSLATAYDLAKASGKRPSASLISDLAVHTLEAGKSGLTISLAQELYESYPNWRAAGHRYLALSFEKAGYKGLSRAHHKAADRLLGRATGRGDHLPDHPLTTDEVVASSKCVNNYQIIREMLSETSLGFPISSKLRQAKPSELSPWELLLLERANVDERVGGRTLAGSASFKFIGNVQLGRKRAWARLRITNKGKIPLSGFGFSCSLLDANKKKLITWPQLLSVDSGAIDPGGTKTVTVWFPDYAQLGAKGVRKAQIKSWSLVLARARAMSFLADVKVVGEFTKKRPQEYRFQIENRSAHDLTALVAQCQFVDGNGKPLLDKSGRPLVSTVNVPKMVLKAGTRSVPVNVRAWGDPKHLVTLGARSQVTSWSVRVRIVDSSVERPRP